MSDETLKPCPFCWGEAHTYKNNLWHVACENAYARCVTMSAFVTESEAIAAWNARAAKTIGKVQVEIEPVLHGTLTAEQVREAIERNFGKVAVLDDGKPVEWRDDWVCKVGINYKAIADELNAELGSWTCENVHGHCSECGAVMYDAPNFCPNCGRRVGA